MFNIAAETTSFPTLLENTRKSTKTKFHLHTSHLFLNAWLAIDVLVLGPQRTNLKQETRADAIIEIFPPTGGPTKHSTRVSGFSLTGDHSKNTSIKVGK